MRKNRPEEVLRRYHAWEPRTDKLDFQWRARLLQSKWREEQGLAPGESRGKIRGSRLAMPEARDTLANYLTPEIRELVRREVEDPERSKGKLYGRPRIYDNLLSSQPLCFNLFGPLADNLDLATSALSALSQGRVHEVTAVDFEYSPGRGDERYTGDRSAFDVYIRYRTRSGGKGFVGIEVKYHEGLGDPLAEHRGRYDEVASGMGCFTKEGLASVRERPLQQIWRDHLLAGAHRTADDFQDGFFVFLYPAENSACQAAVEAYERCLSARDTFAPWKLSDVAQAIGSGAPEGWLRAFTRRYLELDPVDVG